jgi:hypothetical protein
MTARPLKTYGTVRSVVSTIAARDPNAPSRRQVRLGYKTETEVRTLNPWARGPEDHAAQR